MSDDLGDVLDAHPYSVEELREAVFEGRGPLARPLALALLSRKDYPGKVADLQRILTSEGEVPRLRAMAATALGEIPEAAAVRALERGLAAGEDLTVRSAAKALARAGTRRHLKLLEALAARAGPVGRAAQRAAHLLAERLGGVSEARPAPSRTLPPPRGREALRIEIEDARAREVTSVLKSLTRRGLTSSSALSLRCGDRQLFLLFDQEALARGMGMLDRAGEVAIVAERRQVEGTGWESRYRVTIEPTSREAFRITLTTSGGRLFASGTGRVGGAEAGFQLLAPAIPGALPLELRGRFDGERVTFERAESASRRNPGILPLEARTPP